MAEVVYILCFLTSTACALLLSRSFFRNRTRLLMWSSLCFTGLAVNNLLLVVDLVFVPSIDLALARSLTALVALGLLVIGMVWEVR